MGTSLNKSGMGSSRLLTLVKNFQGYLFFIYILPRTDDFNVNTLVGIIHAINNPDIPHPDLYIPLDIFPVYRIACSDILFGLPVFLNKTGVVRNSRDTIPIKFNSIFQL
jgi:hypothetical protein